MAALLLPGSDDNGSFGTAVYFTEFQEFFSRVNNKGNKALLCILLKADASNYATFFSWILLRGKGGKLSGILMPKGETRLSTMWQSE